MRSAMRSAAAAAATIGSVMVAGTSAFDMYAKDNVAIYWGQGAYQGPLRDTCNNDAVNIVNVAFVNMFPDQEGSNGYPGTNFGNACGLPYATINGTKTKFLASCPTIGSDIVYCQSKGKKVLLSLGGGANPTYYVKSAQAAADFSIFLWKAFGPKQSGDSTPRPFGDAVIDGFDFDIETVRSSAPVDSNGKTIDDYASRGYDVMANYLKAVLFPQDKTKEYYLSAAPQCMVPDAHLDGAIKNAWFDWLFIQFYNTPQCSARAGYNHITNPSASTNDISYNAWADVAALNPWIRLYIGLPAGPGAAGDGYYLTPPEAAVVISQYQADPKFGGVALWEATYSKNNTNCGKDYAQWTKAILDGSNAEDYNKCSASATSSALPKVSATVVSVDGSCGFSKDTLVTTVCQPGYCCSQYGYCGSDPTFCGAGCQPKFGQCSSGQSSAGPVASSTPCPSSSPVVTAKPVPVSTVSYSHSPVSTSVYGGHWTADGDDNDDDCDDDDDDDDSSDKEHYSRRPYLVSSVASSQPQPASYSAALPSGTPSSPGHWDHGHYGDDDDSDDDDDDDDCDDDDDDSIPTPTPRPSYSGHAKGRRPTGKPWPTKSASPSDDDEDCDDDDDDSTPTPYSRKPMPTGKPWPTKSATPSADDDEDCDDDDDSTPTPYSPKPQPTPYGSNSLPVGSNPTGSKPSGSYPAGSQPTGPYPAGSQPAGSMPPGPQAFGSVPVGPAPTGPPSLLVSSPASGASPTTVTTVITTSYVDICPTGLTTVVVTYTTTFCPETATQTGGVPAGWTTTVAVCNNCGAAPTTVTLTKPADTHPIGAASTPVVKTIYSTQIKTITQCPQGVPNCPANQASTIVYTNTYAVGTTTKNVAQGQGQPTNKVVNAQATPNTVVISKVYVTPIPSLPGVSYGSNGQVKSPTTTPGAGSYGKGSNSTNPYPTGGSKTSPPISTFTGAAGRAEAGMGLSLIAFVAALLL